MKSPGNKKDLNMENAVSNPKDYVVVTFHNNVDFGFTPEMGCMYDGRPIHGRNGLPGLEPGETKLLPYHVGRRLAINLAKRIFNTSAPATVDPAGIPTGVPIWNEKKLQDLADTFIKEEYSDAKPAQLSETDKLMAKVAELEKFVKDNVLSKPEAPVIPPVAAPEVVKAPEIPVAPTAPAAPSAPVVYQDKKEVIAELEKRGIKFDRRSKKADLEKLLA